MLNLAKRERERESFYPRWCGAECSTVKFCGKDGSHVSIRVGAVLNAQRANRLLQWVVSVSIRVGAVLNAQRDQPGNADTLWVSIRVGAVLNAQLPSWNLLISNTKYVWFPRLPRIFNPSLMTRFEIIVNSPKLCGILRALRDFQGRMKKSACYRVLNM